MTVHEWVGQVAGVARVEMIMHWRRRSAAAIVVFMLVGLVGLSLITGGDLGTATYNGLTVDRFITVGEAVSVVTRDADGNEVTFPVNADDARMMPRWTLDQPMRTVSATFGVMFTAGIGLIVLMVGTVLMLADTLPVDTQTKMVELLTTLPLYRSAYLVGKVVGAVVPVMIGLLALLAVYAGFAWLRWGPYRIDTLIQFWLATVMVCGAAWSGLAVILGGLARTRRTALLLGMAAIPFAIGLIALLIFDLFAVIDPSRREQVFRMTYDEVVNLMIGGVVGTLSRVAIVVSIGGIALWGWQRLREYR